MNTWQPANPEPEVANPEPVEETASTAPADRPRGIDWLDGATFGLAALLVSYLALESGGYDLITRSEVGILVWWTVLLTVAVGLLPVPGRTRLSLAAIGLLAVFTGWTALAVTWSESAERTVIEATRVTTYVGVFLLGISLVTRRREAARPLLGGITFALGFVAALGVLSRLKLGWFPENVIGTYLPGIEIERRLAYPLNYSSAIGIMAGMTLPLVWGATFWVRHPAVRALAAAAIPLAGLALFLSKSSGGAGTAIIGLIVLLALVPDRIPKLLTLGAGTAGGALLGWSFETREALDRGLLTPAAEQQGNEVLPIALAVCAAVAIFQVGLDLAQRRRPPWLYIKPSQAWKATAVAVVIALPAAIAVGVPDAASERWQNFRTIEGSEGPPSSASRIIEFSGSGRYQFWESAVDASRTAPLTGIGPGTFEFWWARNGSYTGFIRDAHSLYLEALAELGIPGLLIISGFVLLILGGGAARSLRAGPDQRLLLAAATAACAAFAFGAALDWIWEIAALPVAFMLLAAVVLSGFSRPDHGSRRRRRNRRRRNHLQRAAVAAVALIAVGATWHSLRGEEKLEESRIAYAQGDTRDALSKARSAVDARPYAASPRIQLALVLESQDRLDGAAEAAREAIDRESTNWRNWLVLARIEARRGNLRPALDAYERVRALNPRSRF